MHIMEKEVYDVLMAWLKEATRGKAFITWNKKGSVVEIYTDIPAKLIGYHGELIDKYRPLLGKALYINDPVINIYEMRGTVSKRRDRVKS